MQLGFVEETETFIALGHYKGAPPILFTTQDINKLQVFFARQNRLRQGLLSILVAHGATAQQREPSYSYVRLRSEQIKYAPKVAPALVLLPCSVQRAVASSVKFA